MITSWTIFFWIVQGALCYRFAKQRGRHPVGWFFIGLVMGLLGVILLFVLPKKKPVLATAGSTTINVKQPPATPPRPEAPKVPTYWYYLSREKQQEGPVSKRELQTALDDGKLTTKSLVWNETLEAWTPFEQI